MNYMRLASSVLLAVGLVAACRAEAPTTDVALSPLTDGMYHDTWIDFNKNGKKDVYEDQTAAIDDRVEDLLAQMTVDEKTCQLVTLYGYRRVVPDDLPTVGWKNEIWKDGLANIDEHINGVVGLQQGPGRDSQYVWPPSKHVRAINEVQRWFVEETRLGAPVDFTNEGIRGVCYFRATNFPAQVGVGATWDKALVGEIGRVTGAEARAAGYTNIYSPILDLARDPRWGRALECYGEDPYLVSRLGVAQARGLQSAGVASTAKHFTVYSVPKGGRDGNVRTDPHVAPRELEMMYLAPFEAAIREVGILGVMSSYNDYDGIPVSGSHEMLTDRLRDQMGFRGYVVSDSRAVRFLWDKHHVAANYTEAVRQFLESGGNVRTDFTPPRDFVLPVRRLIADHRISMDTIDDRVRDVLRVKFQLGLFDRPYVMQPDEADQVIHCDEHRQLALRAARESIVLLKNQDDVLPLAKDAKAILVCGPNAADTSMCISRYGPTGGKVISVLDGIRAAVSPDTKVLYAKGCNVTDSRWPESEILPEPPAGKDVAMIEQAVEKARDADVVVAVLGDSHHTIGEGLSRTSLDLPGFQLDLVKALQATGKPVVVVLVSGRAMTINWIDRHVPAIVEAWFPGEWCGRTVADVLFGDYNPGGKLPVTFPRTVGEVLENFPYKPSSQAGQNWGREPNVTGTSRVIGDLYPFGYGLSYTTFAYSDLEVAPAAIEPGDNVRVRCIVRNTGDRAGDAVVQLYLRDDYSSVTTYDHVLRGFERVPLQPGESQTVTFELGPRDMELLDRDMQRVVEPGTFTVMIGSSSQAQQLTGHFEVKSPGAEP